MTESIEKELKNLQIHEEFEVSENCHVIRVVGGWIYKHYDSKDHPYLELMATTFVPEKKDS